MGTAEGAKLGIANRLKDEFRCWRQAWRELPANPLYHYQLLAQNRRKAASPAWRRNLLLILVLALTGFWIAMGLVDTVRDYLRGYISFGDMVGTVMLMALIIAAVVWGVRFITAVYDTAMGVMGFLAGTATRDHRLMLDDMSSISTLSNYDFTVAVVWTYWPRLIRLSLGGAFLFMVYILDPQNLPSNLFIVDEVQQILLLSPLTILCMAAGGALGGLILILWLFTMGNNLTRPIYASMTGSVLVFGYVMYVPMMLLMSREILVASYAGRPEEYPGFPIVLVALGITLAFILCFYLLLLLAERLAWLRSFLGPGTSLLFFLGVGLMIFYFIWLESAIGGARTGEYAAIIGLAYMSSWSTSLLLSPLSVPMAQCYGWEWGESWVLFIEWFRFPLLLLQQLAMVTIGLNYARRAVGLRRCRQA